MAAQLVYSKSSSSLSLEKGLIGNLVYGTISIKGHSPNMNDRWFVKEVFCQPNIMGGLPLHFIAVYDGHSSYHPNRQDELERIYAAGGKLINKDGFRVNCILSTTCAIGNHLLKGIIIPEPKISITEREVEDGLLILASNGLWDVFSNARACEIVSSHLKDETLNTSPRYCDEGCSINEEMDPTMFPTKTTRSAFVLTKLALERESQHNITVIVVDLSKS